MGRSKRVYPVRIFVLAVLLVASWELLASPLVSPRASVAHGRFHALDSTTQSPRSHHSFTHRTRYIVVRLRFLIRLADDSHTSKTDSYHPHRHSLSLILYLLSPSSTSFFEHF